MAQGRWPQIPKIRDCIERAWYLHKGNCLRRGTINKLTLKIFSQLISGNCAYCGSFPRNSVLYLRFTFLYQGIDRMDNSKGYIPGNVVPCCLECNSIKGKNLSHHEMIQVAQLLLKMRGSRLRQARLRYIPKPRVPLGSTRCTGK